VRVSVKDNRRHVERRVDQAFLAALAEVVGEDDLEVLTQKMGVACCRLVAFCGLLM
jgi:hypothetical protein